MTRWAIRLRQGPLRRERECRFGLAAYLAADRFGGRSLAETLTLLTPIFYFDRMPYWVYLGRFRSSYPVSVSGDHLSQPRSIPPKQGVDNRPSFIERGLHSGATRDGTPTDPRQRRRDGYAIAFGLRAIRQPPPEPIEHGRAFGLPLALLLVAAVASVLPVAGPLNAAVG